MNTIQSLSYNEEEILNNILTLHVKSDKFELDPTYSTGNFYTNNNIKEPDYKFDIVPKTEDTKEASSDDLPFEDNSIHSIIFDPPFVISKGPSLENPKEGQNMISTRFSSFPDINTLWQYYEDSMKEFHRILKKDGVLVFKCQDTVTSGKNYFSHCYIMNKAVELGYYPKDLFVYATNKRLISGKVKKQQHARKFHSYFWVFEKNQKAKNISYL